MALSGGVLAALPAGHTAAISPTRKEPAGTVPMRGNGTAVVVRPYATSTVRNAHPRPEPSTTPRSAPYTVIYTDPSVIIARICRRWVPTARSMPISCRRSITDRVSVFTMPRTAMTTAKESSA